MVIAFLVALNASSLCVARTDICAPAGSTLDGTIGQSGGQVTITPSKPLKALGAQFKAGTKVYVNVIPWWSSDKTSGAVVHVSGELAHETVISGARVAGTVRIGQIQGKKTPPQLVEATDFKGGALKVGTAGTVDVGPGMKIIGNVDIASVRLDVTSAATIHALGLDLVAGTVRVEQTGSGTTIGGTLVRPQSFGGVLVDKQLYATLAGSVPRFGSATLAGPTKLEALGLPDGEAPAGTVVRATPGSTQLIGAGPFTVCGLALKPVPAIAEPAVTFSPSAPTHIAVSGALVGRDVDVGGGVHMTGPITLRYALGGCTRLGLEGTLAAASEQHGLHFAANTAIASGELTPGNESFVRGKLARPEVVDGLTLKGEVMVRVAAGAVHLLDGTLAKAAPFEDWDVRAGTHVQRFGTGWSFTMPKGQSAKAKAVHRGERVDNVIEARSDDSSTTFTLARPHTPKGTTLAMVGIGIDHHTGCVLGGFETPQRFGIFKFPKDGNATLCAGTLVAAEGIYAVPSLQVGKWFATSAFAGDPKTPPAPQGPQFGTVQSPPSSSSSPSSPSSSSSKAVKGYWIQINSLCQGHAGIPLPPPEQRWIWVDLKGEAPSAADRKELAARAAKAGTACPVTPCCPP